MVRLPYIALSWLLFASTAFAQASADASDAEAFDHAAVPTMLARINAMRAAQSLPALIADPRLDAVALAHSQDMADHDMVEHDSPRTGNPMDRALRAGLNVRHVAENVAQHTSVMGAHLGFVQSETHRHNLLQSDLTHIGIGVVRVGRRIYITQLFATFAETAASTPSSNPAPAAPPTTSEPAPETNALASAVAPVGTPVTIEPADGPSDSPDASASAPDRSDPSTSSLTSAPNAPIAAYAPPSSTGPANTSSSRRVAGYWVRGNSGRWWYYPLPPNARPGQILQPDLSVQGGPNAYGGSAPPSRVSSPPQVPSPPPFGWSPRRRYQYWNARP